MDWEGWSEFIESSLEKDSTDFVNSSTQDQWKIIDRTINEATLKFSQCKKVSTHCKPYWTKDLTEASKKLRIAKKSYLKKNTISKKAIMDLAKETFDSIRKSEGQKFILNKTRNLNVAQCKQFWKEFNRLFASKSDKNVDPLHSNDDNIATDPNEIEDILFYSFLAGRHLIEKSPDFDDVFYDNCERIYNTILEADGEHDTGQQHF